jgi:hypothetical protein
MFRFFHKPCSSPADTPGGVQSEEHSVRRCFVKHHKLYPFSMAIQIISREKKWNSTGSFDFIKYEIRIILKFVFDKTAAYKM